MIVPTVGRRVWYRSNGADNLLYALGDQPFDAGVVFVHHDRMVNLQVSDHLGNLNSRPQTKLLQDDDPIPEGEPYAEWMPYQKQQTR